jgi:outer membrane protein TolC
MKNFISIFFLFTSLFSFAQNYDLNYFIKNANVNSPLIEKTKNRNKLLKLQVEQLRSILFKPKIDLEGNLLLAPIISHDNASAFDIVSDGNVSNYTGYDLAYSNGGQYQAFVSIKQALFSKTKFNVYSQKLNVQRQLNENNIILTKHELEYLVTRQYLICLKLAKQRQLMQNQLSQIGEFIKIMQNLIKKGIYEQSDLMLLQIEQKDYYSEYLNFSDKYKSSLTDLKILCGISDTVNFNIAELNLNIKPDTAFQSYFLQKYSLDSLNILAEQKIYEQKYKPQVFLFANLGENAVYIPSFNRLGFALGVSLSWKIFDGNQRKIQRTRSLIKMQTIEFEKQNFIKKYQNQKYKYISSIHLIDSQMAIVVAQLSDYQKLIKIYKIKLSQAQASIMDIKNIFRDINSKKQKFLSLQIQKQILINDYNYWNY